MTHNTYLWFNYRYTLNQQTLMALRGLGFFDKTIYLSNSVNSSRTIKRNVITSTWRLRDIKHSLALIWQNSPTTHYSTPNPHLLQHPPLSSCSDRWLLGVWVNTTQQLHKRAPLGSLWQGVPSQACRSAPGPAPTLADAPRDPQVVNDRTHWSS